MREYLAGISLKGDATIEMQFMLTVVKTSKESHA